MDAFEDCHGHLKVNSMSNRKSMKVAPLPTVYEKLLPMQNFRPTESGQLAHSTAEFG